MPRPVPATSPVLDFPDVDIAVEIDDAFDVPGERHHAEVGR